MRYDKLPVNRGPTILGGMRLSLSATGFPFTHNGGLQRNCKVLVKLLQNFFKLMKKFLIYSLQASEPTFCLTSTLDNFYQTFSIYQALF